MGQQQNEWAVVCEKCGWEGLAHELISSHLEDICPRCNSNKIEWKGEDEEKGFEALYKELAYLEKQRNEQHRAEITALNNKLKFKVAQAKDLKERLRKALLSIENLGNQISKQNTLIVSLEAQIDQDRHLIDQLKKEKMEIMDECNRLAGVAEYWQLKATYTDPDRSGWRQPKIDNI